MDNSLNLRSLPAVCFVTGIGTDVGKTYVTGWIARRLAESGDSVVTQKFVQTGCIGFSEDIEEHRRIMATGLMPEDIDGTTAPVIFSYPASPDLAARIDNKELDLSLPARSTSILSDKYDRVLIEGAGGLMVPLKGDYLIFDYIKDRKLPVVVVTNGQLGSISLTLMTLELLRRDNVEVVAVAYNEHFDKDEIICHDTIEYIRKWLARNYPQAQFFKVPSL